MRIGIVYGHASQNLGDLAINCGTARLLRELAPDAEVRIVLLNPKTTCWDSVRSSFQELRRRSFSVLHTQDRKRPNLYVDYHRCAPIMDYVHDPVRFISEAGLGGCDLVLFSSGDHLFSYSDHAKDAAIDLAWRLLPALAAKQAGMRFVTLPVTVGPHEVPVVTDMLRSFAALTDAFAVRDSRSVSFAAELFDGNAPPVLLDPAFFVPARPVCLAKGSPTLGLVMRLENVGLRVGTGNTSIALANYREKGFGDSRSFRFALAAARFFLDGLGGGVTLLVQSASADCNLTLAIAQALTKQGYGDRIRTAQPATLSGFLEELSKTSFIVSARLHTCILGLLLGKPVMGLHYAEHGHKMPGVFDMLEVPNYCLSLPGPSPEALAESVVPLFLGRRSAFSGVAERLQTSRQVTREWLREALACPGCMPSPSELSRHTLAYTRCIEAQSSSAPLPSRD